jgi:hypothetical protein
MEEIQEDLDLKIGDIVNYQTSTSDDPSVKYIIGSIISIEKDIIIINHLKLQPRYHYNKDPTKVYRYQEISDKTKVRVHKKYINFRLSRFEKRYFFHATEQEQFRLLLLSRWHNLKIYIVKEVTIGKDKPDYLRYHKLLRNVNPLDSWYISEFYKKGDEDYNKLIGYINDGNIKPQYTPSIRYPDNNYDGKASSKSNEIFHFSNGKDNSICSIREVTGVLWGAYCKGNTYLPYINSKICGHLNKKRDTLKSWFICSEYFVEFLNFIRTNNPISYNMFLLSIGKFKVDYGFINDEFGGCTQFDYYLDYYQIVSYIRGHINSKEVLTKLRGIDSKSIYQDIFEKTRGF